MGAQSAFSPQEVAEFRRVFMFWTRGDDFSSAEPDDTVTSCESPASSTMDSLLSVRKSLSMNSTLSERLRAASGASNGRFRSLSETSLRAALPGMEKLTVDGLVNLLRSMGVFINQGQRKDLERRVGTTADANGSLGFAGFLLVMRWILDSNFAGVNDVTATKATM